MVLYTQRVEIVPGYEERRDCADQKIPLFIQACGYLPVPVPNVLQIARKMALSFHVTGIVLTGGNSLVKYGGNAPERDETEKGLLDIAVERKIPVYGFCRGMQAIEDYFGAALCEVPHHVAVMHTVYGSIGECEVNSYHNQACFHVPEELEVLAVCKDGVIEAVKAKHMQILGTMWHPERGQDFQKEDIKRVHRLFGKEKEK